MSIENNHLNKVENNPQENYKKDPFYGQIRLMFKLKNFVAIRDVIVGTIEDNPPGAFNDDFLNRTDIFCSAMEGKKDEPIFEERNYSKEFTDFVDKLIEDFCIEVL